MPEYQHWAGGRFDRKPAELHDEVLVDGWGWEVRNSDVGRRGRVVKVNRTTVTVLFADHAAGERRCRTECLRLITRQVERHCPVCLARPDEKCVGTGVAAGRPMLMMHRER